MGRKAPSSLRASIVALAADTGDVEAPRPGGDEEAAVSADAPEHLRPLFLALARSGDALFVIDRDYRIVVWNKAAQTLLRYAPSQVLGQHCFGILNGTDIHGHIICGQPCEPVLALNRKSPPGCFASTVRQRTGAQRPVEISLLPLPGGFVAHILRDAARQIYLERFADQIQSALDRLGGAEVAPVAEAELQPQPLTPREREILILLARGESTRAIASRLVLSVATVRKHVQHILAKLGARHRLEAVTTAQRLNLL
jgi:DNA-binding CsgD family transcriptional regulator